MIASPFLTTTSVLASFFTRVWHGACNSWTARSVNPPPGENKEAAMLVLTRKRDEQIQIGKDVTITIVRLHGNMVRIGIEAPRDVRVRRAELPPLTRAASSAIHAWATPAKPR
jgi:carbon storage regulator CsrA